MKKNEKKEQMLSIPEINKRVLEVLKYKNYTGYRLEKEKTGIKQVQISHIKNGRNKPSLDLINLLVEKFPDLNKNWIISGEGEMIYMEGKSIEQNFPIHEIRESAIEYAPKGRFPKRGSGSAIIPVYNKDFIAGDAVEVYEDPRDEQVSYYMQIPQFKGCIGFPVYTDSMEKLIKAGSICFGQKLEMWNEHLEYGQVYGIVCHDNRRYLKYIKKFGENEDEFFYLVSENDHYDSFRISKKMIKNVWLVHGWINLNT